MLKHTGSLHVDVGRDLTVDEASVAARSKFARYLIVYNNRKPTGKYHFKLYMTCCATTWLTFDFRLHRESTMMDRSHDRSIIVDSGSWWCCGGLRIALLPKVPVVVSALKGPPKNAVPKPEDII
jgi:hypothetical protein